MTPLQKLLAFAARHDLKVTATTGGHHVPHSLHFMGRAIDVSTHGKTDADIDAILADAHRQGFRSLDERHDPEDGTPWSGSHLHISDPPPGWTGGA